MLLFTILALGLVLSADAQLTKQECQDLCGGFAPGKGFCVPQGNRFVFKCVLGDCKDAVCKGRPDVSGCTEFCRFLASFCSPGAASEKELCNPGACKKTICDSLPA